MNPEKLKEFLIFAKEKAGVTSGGLMEKDFYLNALLCELENEEFAFKGGTCLAKAYLNYHRLSEDLDFTWVDQSIFKDKTSNEAKKICSEMINTIGNKVESAATLLGLDFKFEKGNRHYIEIGSNNKLVTFKLWYTSVWEGASFIKIQLTFVEGLEFPTKHRELKPTLDLATLEDNEHIYFQNFLKYYNLPAYRVYDLKEIACEKIRAILTRRGIKTRDALDLYFIEKETGVQIETLESVCKEKTSVALKKYSKYRKNFKETAARGITMADFAISDTKHLLLRPLDEEGFNEFLNRLVEFLGQLLKDLS